MADNLNARVSFQAPATSGNKRLHSAPKCHRLPLCCGGLTQLIEGIKDGSNSQGEGSCFTDADGSFVPRGRVALLAKRYRFLKILGQGVSAVVVRARDTFRHNHQVAIKIMNVGLFHLGCQEANRTRKLNQADPQGISGTVRLLNTFELEGHFCMVYELLNPKPLHQYFLRPSPVEKLPLIRKVAIQLIKTLSFLQSQDVIHADVKPENILCAEGDINGKIKLIDFGNAIHCIYDELSLYYEDYELQTIVYRAPEVMCGMQFGPEVDMWSVGCILAELYIGEPLFNALYKEEILVQMHTLLGPLPAHIYQRGKFYRSFQHLGGPAQSYVDSYNKLRTKLGDTTCGFFVSFLLGLLQYDSNRRMTVHQAIQHPFLAPEAGIGLTLLTGEGSISHGGIGIGPSEYTFSPHIPKELKKLDSIQLLRQGTAPCCPSQKPVKAVAQVPPFSSREVKGSVVKQTGQSPRGSKVENSRHRGEGAENGGSSSSGQPGVAASVVSGDAKKLRNHGDDDSIPSRAVSRKERTSNTRREYQRYVKEEIGAPSRKAGNGDHQEKLLFMTTSQGNSDDDVNDGGAPGSVAPRRKHAFNNEKEYQRSREEGINGSSTISGNDSAETELAIHGHGVWRGDHPLEDGLQCQVNPQEDGDIFHDKLGNASRENLSKCDRAGRSVKKGQGMSHKMGRVKKARAKTGKMTGQDTTQMPSQNAKGPGALHELSEHNSRIQGSRRRRRGLLESNPLSTNVDARGESVQEQGRGSLTAMSSSHLPGNRKHSADEGRAANRRFHGSSCKELPAETTRHDDHLGESLDCSRSSSRDSSKEEAHNQSQNFTSGIDSYSGEALLEPESGITRDKEEGEESFELSEDQKFYAEKELLINDTLAEVQGAKERPHDVRKKRVSTVKGMRPDKQTRRSTYVNESSKDLAGFSKNPQTLKAVMKDSPSGTRSPEGESNNWKSSSHPLIVGKNKMEEEGLPDCSSTDSNLSAEGVVGPLDTGVLEKRSNARMASLDGKKDEDSAVVLKSCETNCNPAKKSLGSWSPERNSFRTVVQNSSRDPTLVKNLIRSEDDSDLSDHPMAGGSSSEDEESPSGIWVLERISPKDARTSSPQTLTEGNNDCTDGGGQTAPVRKVSETNTDKIHPDVAGKRRGTNETRNDLSVGVDGLQDNKEHLPYLYNTDELTALQSDEGCDMQTDRRRTRHGSGPTKRTSTPGSIEDRTGGSASSKGRDTPVNTAGLTISDKKRLAREIYKELEETDLKDSPSKRRKSSRQLDFGEVDNAYSGKNLKRVVSVLTADLDKFLEDNKGQPLETFLRSGRHKTTNQHMEETCSSNANVKTQERSASNSVCRSDTKQKAPNKSKTPGRRGVPPKRQGKESRQNLKQTGGKSPGINNSDRTSDTPCGTARGKAPALVCGKIDRKPERGRGRSKGGPARKTAMLQNKRSSLPDTGVQKKKKMKKLPNHKPTNGRGARRRVRAGRGLTASSRESELDDHQGSENDETMEGGSVDPMGEGSRSDIMGIEREGSNSGRKVGGGSPQIRSNCGRVGKVMEREAEQEHVVQTTPNEGGRWNGPPQEEIEVDVSDAAGGGSTWAERVALSDEERRECARRLKDKSQQGRTVRAALGELVPPRKSGHDWDNLDDSFDDDQPLGEDGVTGAGSRAEEDCGITNEMGTNDKKAADIETLKWNVAKVTIPVDRTPEKGVGKNMNQKIETNRQKRHRRIVTKKIKKSSSKNKGSQQVDRQRPQAQQSLSREDIVERPSSQEAFIKSAETSDEDSPVSKSRQKGHQCSQASQRNSNRVGTIHDRDDILLISPGRVHTLGLQSAENLQRKDDLEEDASPLRESPPLEDQLVFI